MAEGYELICKIGEGTFGEVYKARRVRDGVSVALKKLRIRRAQHGLPQIVLREIKALQHIRHANVVRLWDYFATGAVVVIACEYMAADLHEVMSNMRRPFTEAEVKGLMRMLLEGVAGIHACNIIHRDLKPSNLLLSPSGVLKIGDFGLARVNSGSGATFSHQVATRWYRAPELLYGARNYSSAVDLWSVGCIFAELLNHSPFVAGENDIDQLYRVLRVMGTPTDASWPEAKSLPDFNKIQFSRMEAIPLEQLVPDASADAVSLLGSLLTYREKDRISAEEALLHRFFFTEPFPSTPADLVQHIPLQSRSSQPPFDVNAAFSLPLEDRAPTASGEA